MNAPPTIHPSPSMLQRFLFGGPGGAAPIADAGLLVLRLLAGLALAFAHGLGKIPPSEQFVGMVGGLGFPLPGLFAWAAGLAEFGGGLLLAVGLLTRPAALVVAINMAVAFFLAHADDPFGQAEKAYLFGAVALLFLLAGAGRYSVDAVIRGRRGEQVVSRYARG
ncbi:MAG: DoxX family protein [Rhodothermales bacterium]|nr:DoxX family protein [Rhodothermales bacterium]